VELVEFLLDHGTDPNLTDVFGRTARLLAQKKGNTAVVALLSDSPAAESS
jgi:ankyrin repeat protein